MPQNHRSKEQIIDDLVQIEKGERNQKGQKLQPSQQKQALKQRKLYTMDDLEPGENRRMLQHAIEVMNLPPIDTYDPQAIADRATDYFQLCMQNDMRPNFAGFCLSLGMSRQQVFNIRKGVTRRPKECIQVIDRVQALLGMQMEDYMQTNRMNPVAGIFLMKNNYNYTNVDKPAEEKPDTFEERKTVQQLVEKYADIPDDD